MERTKLSIGDFYRKKQGGTIMWSCSAVVVWWLILDPKIDKNADGAVALFFWFGADPGS